MILASKEFGSGKPLVILHGLFGFSDNWKTQAKVLSGYFRVVLVDLRNHGRSSWAVIHDYTSMAQDVLETMDYLEIKEAHIIGHSMGGKTAMLFAVNYPNLVDKLIIVDISPKSYQPHHNAILAGLNSIDFSIQDSRKLVDEQLSSYISEVGIRQFLMKNIYCIYYFILYTKLDT